MPTLLAADPEMIGVNPKLRPYRRAWGDAVLDLLAFEMRVPLIGVVVYGLACGALGAAFLTTLMTMGK